MRKLESLEAWKIAQTLWGPRAAISIPANLAEGYGLGTTAQLVRFIRISLGSTYELICHIELARDVGLIKNYKVAQIMENLNLMVRLLVGWLKKLHAKPTD